MAVAIGKKIVAVDLFDKPSTCGKAWDRLMSGYVLDALEVQMFGKHATEEQADQGLAETADMEQLLGTAGGLAWRRRPRWARAKSTAPSRAKRSTLRYWRCETRRYTRAWWWRGRNSCRRWECGIWR